MSNNNKLYTVGTYDASGELTAEFAVAGYRPAVKAAYAAVRAGAELAMVRGASGKVLYRVLPENLFPAR